MVSSKAVSSSFNKPLLASLVATADLALAVLGVLMLMSFDVGLTSFENGGHASVSAGMILAAAFTVAIVGAGAFSAAYSSFQMTHRRGRSAPVYAVGVGYVALRAVLVLAICVAAVSDGLEPAGAATVGYLVISSAVLAWALLPGRLRDSVPIRSV